MYLGTTGKDHVSDKLLEINKTYNIEIRCIKNSDNYDIKYFVNGEEFYSTSSTQQIINTERNFNYIGKTSWTNCEYFKGRIYNFKLNLADGTTIIDNAAKEPHIVDVANFLNTMGADIRGAGTDIIKIHGTKKLCGGKSYSVVPDQIEAGTFMLAAVATRGDITIKNCIPEHLESVTAKILEIGGNVDISSGDEIRVWCDKRPSKAIVKTLPHPGFPTDLQPQMGVVLALADGTSIINESIWESRFQYTAELNNMGAKITAQGKSAIFEGVDALYGAPVHSTDLRAGAALIIAGCAAHGKTEIYNIEHIDRGYEKIENKFRLLGANIERVSY